MNVEFGTEAGAIPFLGMHKYDFRCSVAAHAFNTYSKI
jgi:hypothetical protein